MLFWPGSGVGNVKQKETAQELIENQRGGPAVAVSGDCLLWAHCSEVCGGQHKGAFTPDSQQGGLHFASLLQAGFPLCAMNSMNQAAFQGHLQPWSPGKLWFGAAGFGLMGQSS